MSYQGIVYGDNVSIGMLSAIHPIRGNKIHKYIDKCKQKIRFHMLYNIMIKENVNFHTTILQNKNNNKYFVLQ